MVRIASRTKAPAAAPMSPRVQPGWMGNMAVTIGRDASVPSQPIGTGFKFDTWARQRASPATLSFEVWAKGLTDRDNPDLWKQLDVQVHHRFGGSGKFQSKFVNLDGRRGNNAVYAMDLRDFDPWRVGGPSVPTTSSPEGQYARAKMEFFVTVNGAELRPAPGKNFEGVFENYR